MRTEQEIRERLKSIGVAEDYYSKEWADVKREELNWVLSLTPEDKE